MTRQLLFLTAPLSMLALAGCSDEVDSAPDIRAPAAVALGEPVNCITRSRIEDLDIHDDYTIDFNMLGGETYRTTLPNRCPSLGFEERIAYETTIDRVCTTDTFTVIHSGDRRGATCGFGMFTPVRIDDE